MYIWYKLDTLEKDLNTDFTLDNCLFGEVKLTENVDSNTNMATTAYDSIHSQKFHKQMEARGKMSLFLELLTVLLCVLIIEIKIF